MTVLGRASVPGNVLDDGQHALRDEPFRDGPADARNLFRARAVRPVADDVVTASYRNIENRCAIGIDTQRRQIFRDQASGRIRGAAGSGLIALVERGIGCSRRQCPPKRRPQPLPWVMRNGLS